SGGAPDDHEAATGGSSPLVSRDHSPQPGGVDELYTAQVEDQHAGAIGLHRCQALLELRRARDIELADEGDARLAVLLLRDDLERRHSNEAARYPAVADTRRSTLAEYRLDRGVERLVNGNRPVDRGQLEQLPDLP